MGVGVSRKDKMRNIFESIKKEIMNDPILTILALSASFAIVMISIALSVWLFSL